MKILQKTALVIVLMTLLSSCQSTSDPKQILSKKETRKQIMDTIANTSDMMNEMIDAMTNSKGGKMIIQGNEKMASLMMENNRTMMKMMKNNPEMMRRMMSDMMETAKGDSSMLDGMSKTIMENRQIMDKLQKMSGENMNKMSGEKNMNMMENGNNKKNNMDERIISKNKVLKVIVTEI